MIRGTAGIFIVAVVVAAAVFLADRPGRVDIIWQGWQIETSVGVLVAAAVLAALAVWLLVSVIGLVISGPRRILRSRRERRRRAGYRALAQGMVAVAAGDAREAQRFARRADVLLADPPLTLLLSAQAAQLDGDEEAAKKYFTAMLERRETEFLGLRGLLNQALRTGDRSAALQLTERAATLRPAARWVALSRFDLEAREGRWEAARKTLGQLTKRRLISPERARHHRGVILYELSLAALARGDRPRATAMAAASQALTEDLAGPAAHHARLLLAERRARRAAKAVERAWRAAPHPELAQVYSAIYQGEPPLARVKAFERLAAQNPAACESHVVLAEAALEAQLWGEARRHLDVAIAADPTARLCLLSARLEEAEHGDLGAMRAWLDRAVTATPDRRYICAACGGEGLEWHSLCSRCGAFDTLSWRAPAWAFPVATLPIPTPTGPNAALDLTSPLVKVPAATSNGLALTLDQAKNQPVAPPR
ncbi:MAG TPA: heme biosynthesis HemY N-terminal domain-containing protein [Stellaceae bacterium]|nr:heme biosynthesis HemY N-terminal domain-containing protein [Stellaceae bacterium]